jgi:hypothetical protein
MTVKCLNEFEKSIIADMYQMKVRSINQLVAEYGVSRRTIGRVLVERGVESVRRRFSKVQPIATTEQLPLSLAQAQPQSLLQRIKAFFGKLFS